MSVYKLLRCLVVELLLFLTLCLNARLASALLQVSALITLPVHETAITSAVNLLVLSNQISQSVQR